MTVADPRAKANLRDLALENDFSGNMNLQCSVQEKFEYKNPVKTRFEAIFGDLSKIFGSKKKLMVFLPHAFPEQTDAVEQCLGVMAHRGEERGLGIVCYEHVQPFICISGEKSIWGYAKMAIFDLLVLFDI